MELIIKELKGDYPLAKIPTKHFMANEAYFHVINWFKQLCLPPGVQTMKLSTLRTQLLLIPGELVRVGNRPLLKLPAHFLHRKTWDSAIKKLEMLKF